MSPWSLHHGTGSHLQAEVLGRVHCHMPAEKPNQRQRALPAHKPSAARRPSQEAVLKLGCLCCPDPLGPEAQENSYPQRAGTREEKESTDVGESRRMGRWWRRWVLSPVSPKSSLHLPSKPGEKSQLEETKQWAPHGMF